MTKSGRTARISLALDVHESAMIRPSVFALSSGTTSRQYFVQATIRGISPMLARMAEALG